MVTFTVKTDEATKYMCKNILKEIKEKFKLDTQSEALKYIFEKFDEKIEEEMRRPESMDDLKIDLPCNFRKYDPLLGYLCYERYESRKKFDVISDDINKVRIACRSCIEGKEISKAKRLERELEKKGIKSIFELIEIMQSFAEDYQLGTIYMCNRLFVKEHILQLSFDSETFNCPLVNEEIFIKEKCLNEIDPSTKKPPCKFLVQPPLIRFKTEYPERAKKIIKELSQLEYKEKPETKNVDSEIILNGNENEVNKKDE